MTLPQRSPHVLSCNPADYCNLVDLLEVEFPKGSQSQGIFNYESRSELGVLTAGDLVICRGNKTPTISFKSCLASRVSLLQDINKVLWDISASHSCDFDVSAEVTGNFKMSIPTVTSKDLRTPPDAVQYRPFGCPSPYAEPIWYSRNVSPHYTDSHRKLRGAVRKYIDEEILPYAFEWESAGKVPDSAREPRRASRRSC